jgi:hypothetical protein
MFRFGRNGYRYLVALRQGSEPICPSHPERCICLLQGRSGAPERHVERPRLRTLFVRHLEGRGYHGGRS